MRYNLYTTVWFSGYFSVLTIQLSFLAMDLKVYFTVSMYNFAVCINNFFYYRPGGNAAQMR